MTVFLEMAGGGLINADTIERISRDDQERPFAHFKDDSEPLELRSGWGDTEMALMPIVAAQPGYMRLRV